MEAFAGSYIAIGFSFIAVIVVISLVVRVVARFYTRRFGEVRASSELIGREFVDRVLESEGIDADLEEVEEVKKAEFLFKEREVRVPPLKDSSLLTLGISAHELGHASQASNQTILLTTIDMLNKLGVLLSYFFPPLLIIGFIFYFPLLHVALVTYLLILLFLLAKIPLEVNATKKALKYLDRYGELNREELVQLKKLLWWAILTRLTDLTVGFLVLVDPNKTR